MYQVLLVFDSMDLQNEIQKLPVWGAVSEFEIVDYAADGWTAYRKMRQVAYDLVITEIRLTGMDGLQLLRRAKRERLCEHVVLCSARSDFDYARQGIILGAFDYLVTPFDEKLFIQIFNRIKNESYTHAAAEIYYVEEILGFFHSRNHEIYHYIDETLEKIYRDTRDFVAADKRVMQIYQSVIDEIYNENEWLDLYIPQQRFFVLDGIKEGDPESYKQFYGRQLRELFDIFCELLPGAGNEQIEAVIWYVVNNPESDLKQKSIAAEMHMNGSFLSTVFSAYTEMYFVDYLVNIKLRRGAYLFEQTPLKVSEIAARLHYKDTAYFSKIFKQKFGVTPSEYKSRFGTNDFQI